MSYSVILTHCKSFLLDKIKSRGNKNLSTMGKKVEETGSLNNFCKHYKNFQNIMKNHHNRLARHSSLKAITQNVRIIKGSVNVFYVFVACKLIKITRVFRTQSNDYDEVFLQKKLKPLTISQNRTFVDVRLGFKYASEDIVVN